MAGQFSTCPYITTTTSCALYLQLHPHPPVHPMLRKHAAGPSATLLNPRSAP
jgi:hypothetical protein